MDVSKQALRARSIERAQAIFKRSVIAEASGKTFDDDATQELADALEMLSREYDSGIVDTFNQEVATLVSVESEALSQQRTLQRYGCTTLQELFDLACKLKEEHKAAREQMNEALRKWQVVRHAREGLGASVARADAVRKKYPEFFEATAEDAASEKASTATRRRGRR